jgi:hypothetical protein
VQLSAAVYRRRAPPCWIQFIARASRVPLPCAQGDVQQTDFGPLGRVSLTLQRGLRRGPVFDPTGGQGCHGCPLSLLVSRTAPLSAEVTKWV